MSDKTLTSPEEDFSAWYNEVVLRSELADYSPVRGCMVIRPYGFRLWELMRDDLDRRFRETGHENAYFPLFIPQSFISREAEHVEGFAKEMAIVTHTRLVSQDTGDGAELVPDPEAKLEEPLIVRPTSETIIYSMFAKWVQSYRDLPILMNQWANVVRWEMRTRLFLRTTEFLWQEGHTAHATAEEAREEALQMLGVYRAFMEEYMAMPVVTGRKSASERFPGADETFALEAMMGDRKALQAGTSHDLGQNFSRQFELTYQTREGGEAYAWNTSWGVSTRLVGALIMAHGDAAGLVLPPRLAPIQVVVIPIFRNEDDAVRVMAKAEEVIDRLKQQGIRTHLDDREGMSPGAKYYEWELRGVPMRVEIGPKDLDKQQLVLARRIIPEGEKRKLFLPESEVLDGMQARLDEYQEMLFRRAVERREANSYRGVDDLERFREIIDGEGGFVYTGWCGSESCETRVKDETKATIRVLPSPEFRSQDAPESCLVCGEAATEEALWARAY